MQTMRLADAALAASRERRVALEVTMRAIKTAAFATKMIVKILRYVEACLSSTC